MEYRVEQKYIVTEARLRLIEARIKDIMRPDSHQQGKSYIIKSLYLDDEFDSCLAENEAGTDRREKYRIRMYGSSPSPIHLEIKGKFSGYTKKEGCELSAEECRAVMENRLSPVPDSRRCFNRLKLQNRCANMRPKIIVYYERSAFVYPAGNVRVTFDRNISACTDCASFMDEEPGLLIPVMPAGLHVLEVKYDEFLPEFIAGQLETGSLTQTSFSKYYLCRLAAKGEFPVEA